MAGSAHASRTACGRTLPTTKVGSLSNRAQVAVMLALSVDQIARQFRVHQRSRGAVASQR